MRSAVLLTSVLGNSSLLLPTLGFIAAVGFIGSMVSEPESKQEQQKYINSGLEKYNQGKYDDAISDFNTALQINPNSISYRLRGDCFYKLGNYEKAASDYKEASKECGLACRNLGVFYESEYYFKQDFVTAAKYYQQAIEKEYKYNAKEDLERLKSHTKLTAYDAHEIGKMYYNETGKNGITCNYIEAKVWYDKATGKYSSAFYNIGLLYKQGHSDFKKDVVEAAKYFQLSIDKGSNTKNPEEELLSAELTAYDAHQIGAMYHHIGKYDTCEIICNYTKAKKWYDKAIDKQKLNPNTFDISMTFHCIGHLYQCGQGNEFKKNIVEAVRYYKQALDRKKEYKAVKDEIQNIYNSTELTDMDAYNIGAIYHHADEATCNYTEAKKWYDKAIQRNPENSISYVGVGLLYQYGCLGKIDLVEAVKNFQLSIDKGGKCQVDYLDCLFKTNISDENIIAIAEMYHKGNSGINKNLENARKWYERCSNSDSVKKKNLLKSVQRDIIVGFLKEEKKEDIINIINKPDSNGDTELHKAAKSSLLKNYARLILFGANPDIFNKEGQTPFSYIKYKHQETEKITKLQGFLNSQKYELKQDPSEILSDGKITIVNGAYIPQKQRESTFSDLYKIKEIRPILNLAKLAGLGLHRMSNNPKFKSDYDSDDDDIGLPKQTLLINLDATKTTVEGICHHYRDIASKAYGLYTGGNEVFIGISKKDRLLDEKMATIMHELTHFVAKEVFDNDCKPYFADNKEDQEKFTHIANDLRRRENKLDDILKQPFNPAYYTEDQIHRELIVRVPQILVEYPNRENGLKILNDQAHELFEYYKNIFLKKVEQHCKEREQLALSKWPIRFFDKCSPYEKNCFQKDSSSTSSTMSRKRKTVVSQKRPKSVKLCPS